MPCDADRAAHGTSAIGQGHGRRSRHTRFIADRAGPMTRDVECLIEDAPAAAPAAGSQSAGSQRCQQDSGKGFCAFHYVGRQIRHADTLPDLRACAHGEAASPAAPPSPQSSAQEPLFQDLIDRLRVGLA